MTGPETLRIASKSTLPEGLWTLNEFNPKTSSKLNPPRSFVSSFSEFLFSPIFSFKRFIQESIARQSRDVNEYLGNFPDFSKSAKNGRKISGNSWKLRQTSRRDVSSSDGISDTLNRYCLQDDGVGVILKWFETEDSRKISRDLEPGMSRKSREFDSAIGSGILRICTVCLMTKIGEIRNWNGSRLKTSGSLDRSWKSGLSLKFWMFW